MDAINHSLCFGQQLGSSLCSRIPLSYYPVEKKKKKWQVYLFLPPSMLAPSRSFPHYVVRVNGEFLRVNVGLPRMGRRILRADGGTITCLPAQTGGVGRWAHVGMFFCRLFNN